MQTKQIRTQWRKMSDASVSNKWNCSGLTEPEVSICRKNLTSFRPKPRNRSSSKCRMNYQNDVIHCHLKVNEGKCSFVLQDSNGFSKKSFFSNGVFNGHKSRANQCIMNNRNDVNNNTAGTKANRFPLNAHSNKNEGNSKQELNNFSNTKEHAAIKLGVNINHNGFITASVQNHVKPTFRAHVKKPQDTKQSPINNGSKTKRNHCKFKTGPLEHIQHDKHDSADKKLQRRRSTFPTLCDSSLFENFLHSNQLSQVSSRNEKPCFVRRSLSQRCHFWDKSNKNNGQQFNKTLPNFKIGCLDTEDRRPLRLRPVANGANKNLKGKIPPHNQNLFKGDFGDDAGMIYENSECCFIALSDGAGGNRSQGIDPSIFSKNLIASCHKLLKSGNYNAKQLLQLVTAAMKKVEALNILGSATFCMVGFDRKKHQLYTLNIGDSGVKVIRNNEVIFKTKNTMNGSSPCQLFLIDHTDLFKMGLLPTSFVREREIQMDCSFQTVTLKKGDIIIMSSDGFWDVVNDEKLKLLVSQNLSKGIHELSNILLKTAVQAYDKSSRDDILIILAEVTTL